MNHIFYQTKTKYTNTGDVLINRALIEMLRGYGSIHANCSREVPEHFLQMLGLKSSEQVFAENELRFLGEIWKQAGQAKKNGDFVYIFSGPGELSGGNWKMAFRNAALGFLLPVLRLRGIRIVRIGRSISCVSKSMALSEWFRCLSLTHYFVRDTESVQLCKDNGIRKVKLAPDLSWIYDLQHPVRINRTNKVMVSLRRSIYDHEFKEEFVEQTLQRCQEQLALLNQAMGGKLKVCVAYQTTDDLEISTLVYERLRKLYPTEFIDHQMQIGELETYYGAVDFHISNRMHSLLSGYKYGSLPIALVDTRRHVKIAATFRDCGLTELLFDIHNQTDEQRFCRLIDQRDEWMDRLFACEQKKIEETVEALDSVFGVTSK